VTIKKPNLLAVIILGFISLIFSWEFFLKNLVPIPLDIIVGIYFPWRDTIWNNLVAGVPFKNGLISDIVSIIYPWRIYGIELVKQGVFPLWMPNALGGAPLAANFQSGLFYPLNILFFVFSNIKAWSFYIILQPVMASIFCYLFLRNLRIQIFPSLIGGLTFAFSGFMMVWYEYGIVGHAGLWLPLLLLAVDRLADRFSLRWIIMGVFFVSMSILAGYPQIAIYSLFICTAYTLFRYFQNKKAETLLIFPAIIIGILLSSIQLLPGLELMQSSIRQTDPTALSFSSGIIPLKNLVLALVPDYFGNPATLNWWGNAAYNETTFYIGVFGFIFAVFAILNRTKKASPLIFFKLLLGLSLLLAFDNPISRFFSQLGLPGLSTASASRYLFLTDFSLSVLVAYGLEIFLQKQNKKTLFFVVLVNVIVFIGLWLLVLLGPKFLYVGPVWKMNLAVSQRNLILPSLIMGVFFVITILYHFVLKESKRMNFLFKAVILLILVFDLFRFGWKYNPYVSPQYLYPETPVTSFLQKQDGLYRFAGLIPQSMFIPYGLLSAEGYEPLMIKRYSEFAQRINEEKFENISSGSRWINVNRRESPLVNLLGIKYYLTINPLPESETKWNLLYQSGKSLIYENKEVFPRSFIVHDYQVLGDKEILRNLMEKSRSSQKIVYLEEKPSFEPEKESGADKVKIDETFYLKNQVIINTKSESAGFLFLSDTYYPGWQAFVDNQKTKIYRADYTFRAIFLPKGEHQVKFIYAPDSFKWGMLISAATLFVVMASGLILLKRTKC
jgi:hypothetical protein